MPPIRLHPSDIAFTPTVKSIQARKGSRAMFARMEEMYAERPNGEGFTAGRARMAGFYVFNTHLDPTNVTVRDNSAALILNRIKARATRDPFILTGDMNSGEGSSTVRIYKGPENLAPAEAAKFDQPPLRDTFRVARPDETGVSTRQGRQGWQGQARR